MIIGGLKNGALHGFLQLVKRIGRWGSKKNWQRGSKKGLAGGVVKKNWQRGSKMAFDGYFCTFFPINLVVTEKDYIFATNNVRMRT